MFVGPDVGKSEHHCTALKTAGDRLVDQPLPNDEAPLRRTLFAELAQTGEVVVVVDQPASSGSLPVALAQDIGLATAYLPGLVMRRSADLDPGTAKTDAADAFVIAEAPTRCRTRCGRWISPGQRWLDLFGADGLRRRPS